MKGSPKLFIGAAANPFGDPFELRVLRLAKKVQAGADFIQTQCIYNMPKFREYMKLAVDMGLTENCKILAGVTPLKSGGMANYMAKKVPGMDVPQDIVDRIKGVPKEEQAEEGIKFLLRADRGNEGDSRGGRRAYHGHRVGAQDARDHGAHRTVAAARRLGGPG